MRVCEWDGAIKKQNNIWITSQIAKQKHNVICKFLAPRLLDCFLFALFRNNKNTLTSVLDIVFLMELGFFLRFKFDK